MVQSWQAGVPLVPIWLARRLTAETPAECIMPSMINLLPGMIILAAQLIQRLMGPGSFWEEYHRWVGQGIRS